MLAYTSVGTAAIEIKLPNDFIILALMNYKREEQIYKVSLMIRHSCVFTYDVMEDYTDLHISNSIHIKSKVTSVVRKLYTEGSLQKYFDRYDYMLKCFDAGDEVLSVQNY